MDLHVSRLLRLENIEVILILVLFLIESVHGELGLRVLRSLIRHVKCHWIVEPLLWEGLPNLRGTWEWVYEGQVIIIGDLTKISETCVKVIFRHLHTRLLAVVHHRGVDPLTHVVLKTEVTGSWKVVLMHHVFSTCSHRCIELSVLLLLFLRLSIEWPISPHSRLHCLHLLMFLHLSFTWRCLFEGRFIIWIHIHVL